MINLTEYLTASGKYPERAKSPELTTTVINNSNILLGKVNSLLQELGVKQRITVSSGFRPSKVNTNTPNAAKGSLHQKGMAIDILDDKSQTLASLIASRPDLLRKYGLWLESPKHTIGKNTNWVHLDSDSIIRKDRPSRIFIPA